MNDFKKQLKSLGLTSTEAAIYLAGIIERPLGINDLARSAEVTRTTAYHAVETLCQKGMASKKRLSGKMTVVMTPPAHIGHLFDARARQIEMQKTAMLELVKGLLLSESETDTVEVMHFVGKDGVKQAVEEALYCKNRHWELLAPAKTFLDELGGEYKQYFYDSQRSRNISVRSLWEKKPAHKHNAEEIKRREPRILPPKLLGTFSSVIILFDNVCLLVPPLRSGDAVIIRSKELKTTLTAMFNGLWDISTPYSGN